MPGARCTRGLVCKLHKEKRTRAYRFSGGTPTFPAQWLYGLYRALLGERIRLVTVAAGLIADRIRSDRFRHRQLGTSNGCRDHTVLPYALAPFVLRAGIAHERLALRHRCAPTPNASTASLPTFVTTRDRPSCRARTGRAGSADLPDTLSEILPVALICRSRRTRLIRSGLSEFPCFFTA